MAINDVSLTSGMRSNLLSLQGTVDLLNRTQNRLSSGKKVNTAIDNPVSFFASQALNSRASVIDSLKDSMGQAVQTITAADKGITAITAMIEQAKGIAQSALSAEAGTGFATENITLNTITQGQNITIEGTTLTAGPTAIETTYNSFTMTVAGLEQGDSVIVGGVTFSASVGATAATSFELGTDGVTAASLQAKINAYFGTSLGTAVNANVVTITPGTMGLSATTVAKGTADVDEIAISSATSTAYGALTATEFAWTGNNATDAQSLANLINNNTDIHTTLGYTATASNGVLSLSKAGASILDANVTGTAITAGTMTEAIVPASTELTDLVAQFNTMRTQIDELAEDSGYKGKNLLSNTPGLRSLDVKFEGTTLNVQGFDATTVGLDITSAIDGVTTTWTTGGATAINASVDQLDAALVDLRSQSSKLSGNLSIITVRQDFSTNMINTLTAGADKLTLADANEEGANMLMLQTRQSLSTTALSLSAQAAQSVLKLFG